MTPLIKLSATSIDHINMKVKDLTESVSFYSNLFGFEVKQDENPNKAEAPSKIIGNDSIKLCLYEVHDMKPEGGIAHFGFHIDNFSEVIAICKELGVQILYGGEVDWEKSRSVYIVDPSGYEIELSEVSGGGL
ncbi:MAG: VOC family protein [Candidatus Nitrosomaritimum yanchengensis]